MSLDIANALRGDLAGRLDEMLATLRGWVEHESPSRDKAALDALSARLSAHFGSMGAEFAVIPNATGGDHLRIQFREAADPDARPILVMGHFDTVWPIGTLARMPFRVEGDRASGPGIFDMKASLVLLEFALRALRAHGLKPARTVVGLWTSDEEIGSPTSRAIIEDEAKKACRVLVLEPALADGSLKTARKGVGLFTLEVTGKSAHAGVEPEKGASAIVELAHQILRIESLADPAAGTTLNIGTVAGGTTSNVVPGSATATIDVRARTAAEADRVTTALRALKPVMPGTSLAISGQMNRPPMERTPDVAALFEKARDLGASLGLSITEGSTGGGSDGNFTAALGVPTLDGLGPRGAGAHADHEHILIDSLPERAALLALLLLHG
jgi:glutamate carboxypeptidase